MAKVKYEKYREEPKKIRRRRKPMSEEQKAAAVERLAKAREKRAKENPPKYDWVHPEVLALPEENALSFNKVRGWIKTQRDQLTELRRAAKSEEKGAIAKLGKCEGYIRNMESYLRNGDWVDDFYGEYQQNKVKRTCVAMAYNADGTPKRTKGIYYPDLGFVWGEEPEETVE